MPGFNTAGWHNASEVISQNPAPSNGGWLDRVLGRVDDGFDVYDRVRCAVNPQAPGCYQSPTPATTNSPDPQNNTLLIMGGVLLLLLIVVVLIIALKK